MTNPSNAQSPHAASDEAWTEAVRREAVIRPLAAAPRLSKAAVGVAARALGLSAPRVYGLLRVFRRQPVTASLLPTQPGPAKGTLRLAGAKRKSTPRSRRCTSSRSGQRSDERCARYGRIVAMPACGRPRSRRCVHEFPCAACANVPRRVTAPKQLATAFARCAVAYGRSGRCRSCRSTTPRSTSCWSTTSRAPASDVRG